MSAERVVYSIQRTYILTPVLGPGKEIVTCDERIDIPTIEPLSSVNPVLYTGKPLTVIPCIELAGEFLSKCDLTFETNEGVTILPIKIASGQDDSLGNPYENFRYVLVLPKGATGVKSCRLTVKEFGDEIQHNFTFGIMPPPYNYDNALFGYLIHNSTELMGLMQEKLKDLKILNLKIGYNPIHISKGAGKQSISIGHEVLFYKVIFSYPLSPEPTIHKPKITLRGNGRDFVYTLSLNKTTNTVLIDLLTGMITAYDSVTGEIIQQFMLDIIKNFTLISFENFDDIDTSFLNVIPTGVDVG